jgi:hypothetical protein
MRVHEEYSHKETAGLVGPFAARTRNAANHGASGWRTVYGFRSSGAMAFLRRYRRDKIREFMKHPS